MTNEGRHNSVALHEQMQGHALFIETSDRDRALRLAAAIHNSLEPSERDKITPDFYETHIDSSDGHILGETRPNIGNFAVSVAIAASYEVKALESDHPVYQIQVGTRNNAFEDPEYQGPEKLRQAVDTVLFPENLAATNEAFLLNTGSLTEVTPSSGAVRVHIPGSREDVLVALLHGLAVTSDKLHARYQKGAETSYGQTLYDYRQGLSYPQELARPADANLALGLRSEKSGFVTLVFDNRNEFEDQRKNEIPADVLQAVMISRNLEVDVAEFARLLEAPK